MMVELRQAVPIYVIYCECDLFGCGYPLRIFRESNPFPTVSNKYMKLWK